MGTAVTVIFPDELLEWIDAEVDARRGGKAGQPLQLTDKDRREARRIAAEQGQGKANAYLRALQQPARVSRMGTVIDLVQRGRAQLELERAEKGVKR